MFVIFIFWKLLNGHFLFAHVIFAKPYNGTTSFSQESCFSVSVRIPMIWCIKLSFFFGQKCFYLCLKICWRIITHICFRCLPFFLPLSLHQLSHLLPSNLFLFSNSSLFHLLSHLLFFLLPFHRPLSLQEFLLPLFFFLNPNLIPLFLHLTHFFIIQSSLFFFFSFLLFLNSLHYFFFSSNLKFLISSYF